MEAWRSLGNLDIGLLRTFLAVVDCGGVGRAARHIGRSQPATSLQLKRLESQLGAPLFHKSGRHLELTAEGERLAPHARHLVVLHDRTLAAMTGERLSGHLSIGVLDDFADDWLTGPLASFTQVHPQVAVQVRTGRHNHLRQSFEAGELDLLLFLDDHAAPGAEELGTIPVCWIGSERHELWQEECVPLVLLDAPCRFRDIAQATLRAGGRHHRIAFGSHSLSTQWQAVRAGFGISLRTPIGIRPPLRVLSPADGLPAIDLPPLRVLLHQRQDAQGKPALFMRTLLRDAVREELALSAETRAVTAASSPPTRA